MLDRLKKIAEIAVVAAAFLYVAGWGYLYAYFHEFGVSVGDLSLSVQVSLIFSIPVLLTWPAILIILVAASMFAWFFSIQWFRTFSLRFDIVVTIALLLLAAKAVSIAGARLGANQAKLERYSLTSNLPQVSFVLKNAQSAPSCLLAPDTRLLLHANSQYYIFWAIGSSSKDHETRDMTVCIIPDDQVQSVTLRLGI
jgi:hypothetical protein